MTTSSEIREKAISLRKSGLTYSEILAQIPVAKSTLSEWLKSVQLAKPQKQRITAKRIAGQKNASEARRNERINRVGAIKIKAKSEVKNLIKDPLWLSGVTLYWAEGSKEKPWRTGSRVVVTNMDVGIIRVFIKWAKAFLGITDSRFRYSVYAHKDADAKKITSFWNKELSIHPGDLRVYIKPNNGKNFRKNTQDYYHGVFRVEVLKSTDLNRKIAGWIEGVIEYLS
jgi:hypothetical protein